MAHDGGGQFKLMTGDLIRLIETQHEQQVVQLEKLGGINGVAASIGVDTRQGLDCNNASDLKRREDTFGSNYIPPPKPKGLLELMWDSFQDLTIIVLTFSGILSVVLSVTVGDHPSTGWIEGACIIFAVFVVMFVTAVNDYQKEQQLRSLNAVKEDEKIKVIRNGVPAEISKFSLRVDDVARVDLGDIVPADGIVFDEKELKLDESAMTGESDLMVKNSEHLFLLSGTKVMEGLGKMLVVCVGESSQAGIIKKLILGKAGKKGEKKEPNKAVETGGSGAPMGANGTVEQKEVYDEETQSPLEAKFYRLAVLIGKLGTTVAILVFVVMCIRFSVHKFVDDKLEWKSKYVSDYLQFFIVAGTVLAVAIPEGLPLAVTIALAYSVKKVLLDNNLARHLDACETMGSATTICSDKTDTLTTNRMTVMQVWIGGQEFTSTSQAADEMSETTKDVFCTGICVNSTAEILPSKVPGGQPEHTGNKTECALLQFVRDCGVDYPQVRTNTEVGHMLTFSSKKERMSVVIKRSASACRIYTKGATEVVLGLCNKMKRLDGSIASLDSNQKDIIGSSIIEKYASQGFRTLCLSYRDVECSSDEISKWSDDDVETDLTCIGIIGIEDPVFKEVPDAIVVRMITGDNTTTARSIAGKCGILTPGDNAIVLEDQELRSRVLDGNGNIIQAEFDRIWSHLRVMARSSPKDKNTLVTGHMQSNLMPYGPQFVAVTGNDTNDAPALKKTNRIERSMSATKNDPRDVCIVGTARTACGSLQGKLSSVKATDLAAIVIKEAVARAGVDPSAVEEVILGHVLGAGVGQAPAKQAAIKAGLPNSIACTAVNKVCASGMKALVFGAQSIRLGLQDIIVVGGMESMSQAPHMSKKVRGGARYGDLTFVDAIQSDGLFDAFEDVPMGDFAEECARKHNVSREEQDRFAAESYRRALAATRSGKFQKEIVPVEVTVRRGAPPLLVTEDEEVVAREVSFETMSKLRPCFKPSESFGPTVTPGNASPINDGAAALVLMSREKVEALGLTAKIKAVIRGFGDASQEPRAFTTSPALAIPKALANAKIAQEDVNFFEINEAFAVVACANMKLLSLDPSKVNVYGGAVSIGHPLGCSGARIVVTLCSVLEQENGRIGCAAVCNGGGGASAVVIERV